MFAVLLARARDARLRAAHETRVRHAARADWASPAGDYSMRQRSRCHRSRGRSGRLQPHSPPRRVECPARLSSSAGEAWVNVWGCGARRGAARRAPSGGVRTLTIVHPSGSYPTFPLRFTLHDQRKAEHSSWKYRSNPTPSKAHGALAPRSQLSFVEHHPRPPPPAEVRARASSGRQAAMSAVGALARSARTCSNTSTIAGSNCVPAQRRSSASASSIDLAAA